MEGPCCDFLAWLRLFSRLGFRVGPKETAYRIRLQESPNQREIRVSQSQKRGFANTLSKLPGMTHTLTKGQKRWKEMFRSGSFVQQVALSARKTLCDVWHFVVLGDCCAFVAAFLDRLFVARESRHMESDAS